jgi:hypothetical protein
MSQNGPMSLDEIKRRVGLVIEEVVAELGDPPLKQAGGRAMRIRELADVVLVRILQDVALSKDILREGLVRIVRRVMSARNRAKNKAAQPKTKRGKR